MLLDVDVIQDDIDKGEPKRCRECPAALAIVRAMTAREPDRTWTASVCAEVVMIATEDDQPVVAYYGSPVPMALQKLINDVDNYRQAQPASVTVEFEEVSCPPKTSLTNT